MNKLDLKIVFWIFLSFCVINTINAYDTSCTQMPLPNSDWYYHVTNWGQKFCCNNTSIANSWYKAWTWKFAWRCWEEAWLINRNDRLAGAIPEIIVKNNFDNDYSRNEADLDHNIAFCNDPKDIYITNTDYCKKHYYPITSCSQWSIPTWAKKTKSNICCNDNSIQSSWYKEKWRCWELVWLNNWWEHIITYWVNIAKTNFTRAFNENVADPNNYEWDFDKLLCENWYHYNKNSNYCIKVDKNECSQGFIPSWAVKAYSKWSGNNFASAPICCNNTSTVNQLFKTSGRCAELNWMNLRSDHMISEWYDVTKSLLIDAYNYHEYNYFAWDISNLLCPFWYKYKRNTNYCEKIDNNCTQNSIPSWARLAKVDWKNICCNNTSILNKFYKDKWRCAEEAWLKYWHDEVLRKTNKLSETETLLKTRYDYQLSNEWGWDISNLLCDSWYKYVKNTNYCIAESEPMPPVEPEPEPEPIPEHDPVCWNSVTETWEQCDDWNNTPWDWCEWCQNADTYPTTDPDAPAWSVWWELAWCDTKIWSRTPTWSTCNVNWSWSSSWRISCRQTVTNRTPNMVGCANRVPQPDDCTTNASWATICTPVPDICDNAWCYNATHPASESINKTITLDLSGPYSTCWTSKYANNSDSCLLSMNYGVNTEQNKWIIWGAKWSVNNFTDISWEWSNRLSWAWKALNFDGLNSSWFSSNRSWNVTITWISSKSPFESRVWKLKFNLWWTEVVLTWIYYDFKKPFTWKIKVLADNWTSWDWKIILWTDLTYKVVLEWWNWLTWAWLNSYSLDNFLSKITTLWSWLELQNKNFETTTMSNKNWTKFSLRVNTDSSATSINNNPWVQINNSIISYNLWWESVKYILSDEEVNTSNRLTLYWEWFLWVDIIGNMQSDWKAILTSWVSNISDLSTSEFRQKIRSKVTRFISSLSNWQKVNETVYYDRTIKLSDIDMSWLNTIIVKGWNLIIDKNLTETNLFWIVVLEDWYDASNDYNSNWNVYITPNVTKINSIIYADWGLISSNGSWVPYITDSINRTYDLNKQLILNWILFTRNTIWWAIKAGWKYILPGWEEVDNYDNAMIYDLNYIRRWNLWCDKNWNDSCTDNWENKSPFIIKYDSRVQNNTLTFFWN